LLAGLTNKYNIWASTLDEQDVEVMRDRIKNGANLLESHVFQFDFLNDDFSKLPEGLQEIINDPEKRKKLVIYINPPYAEVSSMGVKGKAGVNKSKAHDKYSEKIGTAGREIYILFLARLFNELNGCIIGEFSTLKALQGSAFSKFRDFFKAELIKSFIVPAYTFDNVKGNFPIGFKIWNTAINKPYANTISDVFDETGNLMGQKTFSVIEKSDFINKWISKYKVKNDFIGFLAGTNGNDFQQNGIVYILNKKEQMANPRGIWISSQNLIPASIYYAVRHCVNETWLNNRDQFLYPNDGWESDIEFQNDCLAYTLFHSQNRITSKEGINHWIPFTEDEVNARDKFDSHFMTDFIQGKIKINDENTIFANSEKQNTPLIFSNEAKAVFDAGRELWRYYHSQPNSNPNASYYDIREYFQGRDEKGKMKNKSDDKKYMELLSNLKVAIAVLAKKIEQKVYEYGFLMK
jgi:hypothetical protein